MAKTKLSSVDSECKGRELGHLNFMWVIALNSVSVALDLYEMWEEFVKVFAAPLVPSLRLLKRAILTFLVPIHTQLHTLPFETLYFIDILLDQPVEFLHKWVPTSVKLIFVQTTSVMETLSGSVQKTVHKARMEGLRAAIQEAVMEFYRLVILFIINAIFSAVRFPVLGIAFAKLLPHATGLLNKYIKGAIALSDIAFSALMHLPLVPVNDIGAAICQQRDNINQGLVDATDAITGAIQRGADALNPLQVVLEANIIADKAVSATGQTISNASGMGFTALNLVIEAGEAALGKQQEKIEQGIAGVKEKITESALTGDRAIREVGKVAAGGASAVRETASFASELGSTALDSVMAAGSVRLELSTKS